MSILRALARKKFASGGTPQVFNSDTRVQIPENTSGSLVPTTSSSTMPETGGRQYHPLADADYYTYGQGPEHEFFTGSLPVAPLQPNNLPAGGGGASTPGGGAAGVLGDIVQLAGAAKNAGALANMAGIDNQYTQAMQNPVGAVKNWYSGITGGPGSFANVASGAPANEAVASQIGYPSAIDTGLGAAGVGSTGLVGGGGEFAGAGATGSWGASAGAGATGSGLGATIAGSGLSTALPIAAIGFAAADAINKSMGVGEKGKLSGAWADQVGGKPQYYGHLMTGYKLPDGTVVSNQQAQALSQAWKSGDQAEYARLIAELNGHAKGGRTFETGKPGVLAYTQDPKFNGTVRGAGTGRSDEIPARLSDGEYVMDAETVSMLGDGSTDAGAKKLDQMRAKLRAHKGKTLAKGKFSPNAKDPMEYIQ